MYKIIIGKKLDKYNQFKNIYLNNKNKFKNYIIKKNNSSEIKVYKNNILIYNKKSYINPLKLLKLSLYADYHPDTSNKNFGYKNKEIALKTIKLLENKNIVYQKQVLNTLINRAKYHPYKTPDMDIAIGIFEKYLKKINNI
jgi:hypothetical protein